jgi:hypothetical protein
MDSGVMNLSEPNDRPNTALHSSCPFVEYIVVFYNILSADFFQET